MTDETPLEAFLEGCDRALFLAFREKCPHLTKTDIAGQFYNYECAHPENGFVTTFREQGKGHKTNTGGYPQCSILACPIFKRIERPAYKESYSDTFMRFFDRMKELD